ncbi:hypothetical protein Avbf_18802, partial [Armadillidium vulgare]
KTAPFLVKVRTENGFVNLTRQGTSKTIRGVYFHVIQNCLQQGVHVQRTSPLETMGHTNKQNGNQTTEKPY